MRTVELFCGTKSFSKIAEKRGYETFTVDNDESFRPDMVADMIFPKPKLLMDKIMDADIVWMSPPCQTFSMAAGNRHWTADRQPKTNQAIMGKSLMEGCIEIMRLCAAMGKIYFIENPRARARWFMPTDDTRKTVWYCQYGDDRAKPTDIWTNLKDWKPKTCHNGNKDCHHQPAPRGSKTGTQGLKGAKDRGVIPSALFEEIFDIIESTKSDDSL